MAILCGSSALLLTQAVTLIGVQAERAASPA